MRTTRWWCATLAGLTLTLGGCPGSEATPLDGGSELDVPGLDAPGLDAPGGDTLGLDAPFDAPPCGAATECDDGVFCNGVETCAAGACGSGTPPCPAAACDEAAETCACADPDSDGDGADSLSCGGTDCDDTDPARAPGRPEVCDAVDLDEDCDLTTFGARDRDSDSYSDAACCNAAVDGTLTCGNDCDDLDAGAHPDAPEVCDAVDNDCDGAVDEGVQLTFYRDVDGDAYGVTAMMRMGCSAPVGFSPLPGDCDDVRSAVHPGALDICNSIDDDCNGAADPGCTCTLGATQVCGTSDMMGGFLTLGACRTGTQDCIAGAWSIACGGSVAPTTESCNLVDDDCDGSVDEAVTDTYYRDADGDGYGVTTVAMTACSAPVGYTLNFGDCDDALAAVNPGAAERCNLRDDNCDTSIDEGCGCTPDGASEMCGVSDVGVCRLGGRTCVAGTWSRCSGNIDPGTEVCEGSEDENCDGAVDEGCVCVNGATRICGSSVGVCRSVLQTCALGQWPRDCAAESGVVPPGVEVCEGTQDENCDGAIDEGCMCVNGAVDRSACGTDAGECVSGMRTCTAGAWGACSGGVPPATEVCEGARDENCDGATDEGCTCVNGMSRPCGVGACAGMQSCSGGTWGACSGAAPGPEVCNGIDNDCDGIADPMDPSTLMVGAACGSTVGLCTTGTYSCPSTALVCSGAPPTAEVCDHRDQDCDALLDESVSAGTCSYSQTSSSTVRDQLSRLFLCSWGTCGNDTSGRLTGFTTAGGMNTARGATLTVAGSPPDWGESFSVSGTFDLATQASGFLAQGGAGMFIAPVYAPNASNLEGLPLQTGSAHGYAAIYNTLFSRAELYEMTVSGVYRRAVGSPLGSTCDIVSTGSGRRIVIVLASSGETITATASGSTCGTSTATYVDVDWQSTVYGDSLTASYPVYQVGAHVWSSQDLTAMLVRFNVTRTNTTSRGHCVWCPWAP